jgi:hypothetical protein
MIKNYAKRDWYSRLFIYSTILFITCHCSGIIVGQTFKHPGIRSSKAELDFIKSKVNAGQEPWLSGWNKMMSSNVSSLSHTPNPCDRFTFDTCRYRLRDDAAAAYSNALQWYIKGDTARADKAVSILNIWVRTLRNFDQSCLAVTWGMPIMINAAEIMRSYSGWSSADQASFKSWLSDLVWPFASGCESDNSNWDCGGIALSLAIAVFTDNRTRFDSSIQRLRDFIPVYVKSSGCTNETDRDQGHAQMGLGHLAAACEVAWQQGVDVYSSSSNRLYVGYELNAKYNLGNDIGTCPDVGGVSSTYRGNFGHAMWEIAYNHYHNRKGMAMSYSEQAILQKVRAEGLDNDMLPWGTLVHANLGNLTGTQPTPTPTPTPAPTSTTVINEDCSTITNFTKVRGGTWASASGKCALTLAATTCTGLICNILTQNTSVSGDFTLTANAAATATSSSWDDFVIIFNFQDVNNYYFASFNESDDANTNGIFKMANGIKTEMLNFGTNTTAGSSTLYSIKIERIGSRINVYKGTTSMGTVTDSTFTSGKVGFGASNNNGNFDNLKVTKP